MKELIHININGYQNGNNITETVEQEPTEEEPLGYQDENLSTPPAPAPTPTPDSKLEIPPFINKKTWGDFIEMRMKLEPQPTKKDLEYILKTLNKLKEDGDDPNAVLEQSIMNGWKGVFALHSKGVAHGKPLPPVKKYKDVTHGE
jgi:hypothetical protein